MKIIYVIFILFTLSKCKRINENVVEEKTITHEKNNESSVIDKEYLKELKQLLEDLPYNIYENGDYSIEFKKNKKSILVELLYQLPTGEKYISYSVRNEKSLNKVIHYTMIYNSENDLVISLTTPYIDKKIDDARIVEKGLNDTIFFKDNKIYSHAKKESIIKQKKILKIKHEIDSLFKF